MFRNFIIILLLIVVTSTVEAQNKSKSKFYFGFSFGQQVSGSGLMNYGIVKVLANGKKEIIRLTDTNFKLQIAGKQESLANPDNINFFLENKIMWQTLDQLWKIKYSEYPFRKRLDNKGWAHKKYAPSPQQMKILNQYGIKFITDFCYGDNAFKLLKAMQDGEWVSRYQNAQ